jgi:hypothetical protein
MDQNAWIMLLVGIAVASALFALGIVLYPKLVKKQGYPFEAEIEAALLPLIFNGICAAYRLSENCIKNVESKLQSMTGIEKKKIADSIYRMLPDKIGKFDLILIKRVVTQERFETLVQNAFDNFDRFFVEHQQYFDDLLEKWKDENKPIK